MQLPLPAITGQSSARRAELSTYAQASGNSKARRWPGVRRRLTVWSQQREEAEESGQASDCSLEGTASWRNFRASLVHQERAGLLFTEGSSPSMQRQRMSVLPRHWAHEIAALERGCLLVARKPDMGPLFTQAIVLLLEHDHQGSAGLVLNCPTAGARIRSCLCLPDIAGAFKQQLLYQGGTQAVERLHLLHGNPAVSGTYEVVDGIYTGGLAHANELVQKGQASAREFKLLAGYAHWAVGELDRDIAHGCWWLVAASRDFILSSVQGQQQQLYGVREKAAIWRNTLNLAGLSGPGSRQYF